MSGQPAYRYTGRGYCPVCKTKSDDGLDTHMMCHHLDLGQLWRCPVEWCAVWKGSVRECRDHFNDKHSGSDTIDFDQVWFNNIYSFNQQGKPYIKVSGWQCDYNGVHMCTYIVNTFTVIIYFTFYRCILHKYIQINRVVS